MLNILTSLFGTSNVVTPSSVGYYRCVIGAGNCYPFPAKGEEYCDDTGCTFTGNCCRL